MPEDTVNTITLLAQVLSGDADSIQDAAAAHGLSATEVLLKIAREGIAEVVPTGNPEVDTVHKLFNQVKATSETFVETELTAARIKGIHRMSGMMECHGSSENDSQNELTTGEMRALEMSRRACVSLIRLHKETSNSGPPRTKSTSPKRPNDIPSYNFMSDSRSVNVEAMDPATITASDLPAPKPERIMTSYNFMHEPGERSQNTPDSQKNQLFDDESSRSVGRAYLPDVGESITNHAGEDARAPHVTVRPLDSRLLGNDEVDHHRRDACATGKKKQHNQDVLLHRRDACATGYELNDSSCAENEQERRASMPDLQDERDTCTTGCDTGKEKQHEKAQTLPHAGRPSKVIRKVEPPAITLADIHPNLTCDAQGYLVQKHPPIVVRPPPEHLRLK